MTSQRYKSVDPVVCEAYTNRMMRREKNLEASRKISPVISKQPSSVRTTSPNSINTLLMKKSIKQHNQSLSHSPSHRHSPQYEESTVEIKLKSTKPRKSSETWASCLKNNKTRDPYGFNNFDPLRLVHFLTKELKSHLQTLIPEDDCTRDMIGKLENALNRVPPEVASAIHLHQALELIPRPRSRSSMSSFDDQKPVKLENKKPSETKSAQTVDYMKEENEMLQKVMTENTEKLESKVKQLEEIMGKLKLENEQRKNKIAIERDNVAYYKGRLEELEKNHAETVNVKIYKMEEEKSLLENQIGDLKLQLTALSKPKEDFKNIIRELKNAKADADTEVLKLRHELKLSEIEKEKYMAVLAVRDRQINEIRSEMSQLQEVVNEQLMELHSTAFSNIPSNTGSDSDFQPDNKETGDGTPSSFTTNDENYKHPEEIFKELQGGDMGANQDVSENMFCMGKDFCKATSNDNIEKDVFSMLRSDSQVSIKDVLTELKRQVYSVNSKSLF